MRYDSAVRSAKCGTALSRPVHGTPLPRPFPRKGGRENGGSAGAVLPLSLLGRGGRGVRAGLARGGSLGRRQGSAARIVAALALATLILAPAALGAQQDPRVPESQAYAIRGATVHTLAGAEIPNGTVVIRDGRIEAVGANLPVPAGAATIDAAGMHVYPGMIDAMSRLGLTEIGSVDVTEDVNELGEFNPHLQSATAIHPASEHIPVARANGITHTLSAPGGGGSNAGIPGRAALISLDGWTVEEMAIEPAAAMMVEWPSIQLRSFDFATRTVKDKPFAEAKKDYDAQVRLLEEWFEAAEHYQQAMAAGSDSRAEQDLQLEALARTLDGSLPVIVSVAQRRGIEDAVAFAEEHGLRLILAGARDARDVKAMLAQKNIPVIVGPTQTLPDDEDDPYYHPASLAAELREAGVRIAFGTFNSSDSRTLPYEAANAVPYGLSREEALRAVTVGAADILGVADRVGTIEPGKMANLVVTTGDPLEITTQFEYVFIDGRPVDRANRHQRLYERHRARPAAATATATSPGR